MDILEDIFGDIDSNTVGDTMKDKCRTDFKLFCEYYLSESFPSPWSTTFHFWLIDKLEDIALYHTTEETRTVTAAPRGHAKSTITTFAYPLWLCVYNKKKFIVIISATSDVAKQFIANIRNELEYNELLRKDFGDLTGQETWNRTELLTGNRVYITSKSAGTQLRGLNFNGTRPDVIILDDLETAEQVASPTQTQILERWFESDVMPMGSPQADFFYIGTVLSYESLLYHMLTTGAYASWTRKRFQAVIHFSDSPLWDEWEIIMTDLERGDNAYQDSVDFYNKHKYEMLDGVEVLWEDQRPDMYRHLMERRVANEEGFASEYMNDPQTESTRIFKTEWLENNYYLEPPEIKQVCIAIDPAISAKRRNDYSAIVAVGKGVNNYFYVLEADLAHRKPDQIIEDAKEMIRKYLDLKPIIACETNQMQQFFSTTLQREMVQADIHLDWQEVFHKIGDSKASRIESLVPYIKNGYLKFKASQKILLSQIHNYPKSHDDGVDALEMALHPLLGNNKSAFGFSSTGQAKKKNPLQSVMDFMRR